MSYEDEVKVTTEMYRNWLRDTQRIMRERIYCKLVADKGYGHEEAYARATDLAKRFTEDELKLMVPEEQQATEDK